LIHERDVNAMNARVLGYLLMHMPSSAPTGAAKLAGEIMDCEDEAALDALAKHVIDNFVRVCESTEAKMQHVNVLIPPSPLPF
jgi:hypothetical protein